MSIARSTNFLVGTRKFVLTGCAQLVHRPKKGWVHMNSLVYRPAQGVHRVFLAYRPALLRTTSLACRPEKGLLHTQYLFIVCTKSLLYRLDSYVHNLHRQKKFTYKGI